MGRQWVHGLSHHPKGQVQRAFSGHAVYRDRRIAAELVVRVEERGLNEIGGTTGMSTARLGCDPGWEPDPFSRHCSVPAGVNFGASVFYQGVSGVFLAVSVHCLDQCKFLLK